METVIVSNSQFYSHYPKRIPKNTVNAESVLVRLDPEWDNLTVRIHWINVASGVEKVVLLERDKPNTIPWEVLTDLGELRMGLDGMDGGTIVKPTVWLTYGYVVDGVDPESGSDPQPPTPSWEQQMVALAEAAADAAKAAKETADNLQASAESGEFNGDPGPAGPPGKSPIIRNGTWWIWDVEAQEYRDTGVAASGGGSGGTTDYTELSGKPKINGVELNGNKTAQDLNLQPKGDYAQKTDIPDKLPAPYTLTFAGAVEAAYDGSKAVTVTIPTVAGPPGVSPTVSTEEIDGGTRVTFTFQGGSETVDILDGKTPVKGVDYFTEAEIQDVAKQAAALVPGGGSTKPRVIADITVSGQEVKSIEEDIGNIDDLYSVSVVITPTENFTPSNLFVGFSTPQGECQISLINSVTFSSGKQFVINADRFTDFVSSVAFLNASYMWLNKTSYYAYNKRTWAGATAFYMREYSSGGFPEGTTIKVVGK